MNDRSYLKLAESYKKQSNVSGDVQEYLNAQLECMYQSMVNDNVKCDRYENKSADLLKKVSATAAAMANRDDYILNPSTKKDYLQYLKNERDRLTEEQNKILDTLEKTNPIIGSILSADQLTIANLSDSYKDDNWLEFSFDSEHDYQQTKKSSSHELVNKSWGLNFWFISIGIGSSTSQTDTTKYQQEMSNAKLKAKGKLLRVNIKRPWFKPEVFEDPTLNYVCCH